MVKRRVTSKMVARKAGVSQTTVSFVLNNVEGQNISEETRQRVYAAADALGYVPQVAARSLVQGHSMNVGLVLVRPHYQVFRDPYVPNVITGLVEVLREQGYRLLVEHVDSLVNINIISNLLKGGEVAGVLMSGDSSIESNLHGLINEGYPIVMLGETSNAPYAVRIDHVDGVRQALEHIIALGHKRIGFIYYAPAQNHLAPRIDTVKRVLTENNIEFDQRYIRFGGYEPQTGYDAMKSLLQESQLPTAVFGMNDMMAIGAMHAIQDSGLRIPDDIAVIGYDDMRFAGFANPSLTTIHAPEVEQGRAAGHMLLQLINGELKQPTQTMLQTELIVRASCGSKSIRT